MGENLQKKRHDYINNNFIKSLFIDNNMYCETCLFADPENDKMCDCNKLGILMPYGAFCSFYEPKMGVDHG